MSKAAQTISEVGKVPQCTPQEICSLMDKLDMSEKGFAFIMNVTPTTVKLWTTGAAAPCNPARRLMQVLSYVPGVIDGLAQKSAEWGGAK